MSKLQDNQRIPADKWDSYIDNQIQELANQELKSRGDNLTKHRILLTKYYYGFKRNHYDLFQNATIGQMKDIDSNVIDYHMPKRHDIYSEKYFTQPVPYADINKFIKSATGSSVVSPISMSIAQPVVNANQSKHPLDRKSSTKSVMAVFLVAIILMIAGVTLMVLNLIDKVGDTELYIGMGLFATSLVSLGVAAFQSRKKQN